MDFLQRDQAPLLPSEWLAIDQTVVQVARESLVGRRFLRLYGPLGAGVQAVPNDRVAGSDQGAVDLVGDSDAGTVSLAVRRFLPVPLVYKDFIIPWRDLEASRQLAAAPDTSGAAAAAAAVAQSEDNLVFNGNLALGLEGLRTTDGTQRLALGDWSQPGEAFASVVRATEALIAEHFYGVFTLVANPVQYAQLNRMFDSSGVLVLEQVQKLVRGAVYEAAVLPEGTVLVLAADAANMDLVLGLDMTTAFNQTQNLNYVLRVLESVVLRIKRPAAIVVLDGT